MTLRRFSRWFSFGAVVSAVISFFLATHILFLAYPSSEAVRLRNALLITAENLDPNDWVPPNYPLQFKRDTLPPDPRFVDVVREIGADKGSDFQRALIIAGHLTENARDLGAIQADTWTAYQGIRKGKGYCSDFIQSFIGLASAADIVVREWGFSFDGFGGRGHAVVEIYDRQAQRWVFLDIYNNIHALIDHPLGVSEFRHALLSNPENLRYATNGPGRLGFVHEKILREYYIRGIHGWFQIQGTNLQAYENSPLVRLFGGFSRSAEQALAILSGVHPRISILETPENQEKIRKIRRLRTMLLIELPILAVSLASFFVFTLLSVRERRIQKTMFNALKFPRVMLVGPLPPPSGGMANQCEQLNWLLHAEGFEINFVRTNSPYRPNWVASIKHVRAIFRLVPYLRNIWRALAQSDVVHLFANSGKSWYLVCIPVLLLSRVRNVPCIVNYRGGEAERFFQSAPNWVRRTLTLATLIVTPSDYLARVFQALGYAPRIIPNIVNLERFRPNLRNTTDDRVHLIVTRNLEPIYDIPSALTAFAGVLKVHPSAILTVAGSGPEEDRLKLLAMQLGVSESVIFSGRIANQDIPALYASADIVINPSTVDNMPISILEAFACGLPVVTTNAGGIPYLAKHGETALLVDVGDSDAMTKAVLEILADKQLAYRLSANAIAQANIYSWAAIRPLWVNAYQEFACVRQESIDA